MTRVPAETFSPGSYVKEEIDARGWTTADLASRMGGDHAIDQLIVELMIAVGDKNMLLTPETAEGLARAFGLSSEYFINLDRAWRGEA